MSCNNSLNYNLTGFATFEEAFEFYIKYYNIDGYVDLYENGNLFNFVFMLNMCCSAYLWSYIISLTYVVVSVFIIKTINISTKIINLTSFIGCLLGIYLLKEYKIIYFNLILTIQLTGLILWILHMDASKYFNYELIVKSMLVNMCISLLSVSSLILFNILQPIKIV